jgi:tetratricopeptide (TPR) repeat protein
MTSRTFSTLCLVPLVGSLFAAAQVPPAKSPSAPPVRQTCTVDHRESTEGEAALARKDYKAAAQFYRTAIEKDPKSDQAHLGLTRALIGLDDTTAARTEAVAMLAAHPQSSTSHVAVAEVEYRDANFEAAEGNLIAAMQLDRCDGRALATAAKLVKINAQFALSARYLSVAHQLRPSDELIRREWIDSLPRKQRAI